MTTVWIVPAFDVFEDCHAGLSLGAEYAPVDELAFKGSEETLRHRVVKAVAHRSHGRRDAHLSAAFPEQHSKSWASSVADLPERTSSTIWWRNSGGYAGRVRGMVDSSSQKAPPPTRHLSSLPGDAQQIGQAVRSHWGVENGLHWVMDMVFRDDECRIRSQNAPSNFTAIKQWPAICYVGARSLP